MNTVGNVQIRRAEQADAPPLSDLALRSKAYWGYSTAFLEACRDDLTLLPSDVVEREVFVCEEGGHPLGFYSLSGANGGGTLHDLFVAPEAIGQGVGRRLWRHILGEAGKRGYKRVDLASDPHAELFYAGMGARRVGEVPSTVFVGRALPLMRIDLNEQVQELGLS